MCVCSSSETSICAIYLGVSKCVKISFAFEISSDTSSHVKHDIGEWKYSNVYGTDSVKFVKFSSVNFGTVFNGI